MTSFKRQLLLRLLLIQGLEHYSNHNKKAAVGHALMVLNQVETLIEVYKDLYEAWDVYCEAQMSQEGPWMETSIFTSKNMRISPLFTEAVKVNFWIHYSLEGGLDTLHVQPAHNKAWKATQEEHHFDVIQPMIVGEWNKSFYSHNDIKPEMMQGLFVDGLIKALLGVKVESAFDLEVELLEKARVNTLWDFLLHNKPYAVDDIAYIVRSDKVNIWAAPHGENFHDEDTHAELWELNASYRGLLAEGYKPEEAYNLLVNG